MVQLPASLVRACLLANPRESHLGPSIRAWRSWWDGPGCAGVVRIGRTEITTELGRKVSRSVPGGSSVWLLEVGQRASNFLPSIPSLISCPPNAKVRIGTAHDLSDRARRWSFVHHMEKKPQSESGVVAGWSPAGRYRRPGLLRPMISAERAGLACWRCRMLGPIRRKRRGDPVMQHVIGHVRRGIAAGNAVQRKDNCLKITARCALWPSCQAIISCARENGP